MPVLRHGQRLVLALAMLASVAAAISAAAAEDGKPFRDFDETFKSWKLYCQLWTGTRQVECELSTRGINDRTARLVWLRSTDRWREGLRFRVSAEFLDLDKLVRVWADRAVFKPDSPCKPFRFETNTCAVTDPDLNRRMVEKIAAAPEVSIVGQSPAGEKTEVRFPLSGFREAVERSDAIRAMAGRPWATSPGGD
jgi:invasion protein IalB